MTPPNIASDDQGARWPAEDTCPGSGVTHYLDDKSIPRVAITCACGKEWALGSSLHFQPYTIPPHPRGSYLRSGDE